MHFHTQTHTQTDMGTQTHTETDMGTQTHTQTDMGTQTYTEIDMHTHTDTHARTQTSTCTDVAPGDQPPRVSKMLDNYYTIFSSSWCTKYRWVQVGTGRV